MRDRRRFQSVDILVVLIGLLALIAVMAALFARIPG